MSSSSGPNFIILESSLDLIQYYTYFKQFLSGLFKAEYIVNLHKHQLYLLEQHSESFKVGQQLLGLTLRVNP